MLSVSSVARGSSAWIARFNSPCAETDSRSPATRRLRSSAIAAVGPDSAVTEAASTTAILRAETVLGPAASIGSQARSDERLEMSEIPANITALQVENRVFPPSPDFVAAARVSDPGVYAAAASDTESYWAEQSKALDWIEPWTQVVDRSNAPFYKWFLAAN